MVWPFIKKKQTTKTGGQNTQKSGQLSTAHLSPLEKIRANKDQFFGVKIIRCSCEPSLKIMDKIFTFENYAEEIPRIPLDNCPDPQHCRCQYQGLSNKRVLADRRTGHDRRGGIRIEDERRKNHGRRKADGGLWQEGHEKF